MNRLKSKLKAIVLFLLGLTIAIVLSLLNGHVSLAQTQTTYLLGIEESQELPAQLPKQKLTQMNSKISLLENESPVQKLTELNSKTNLSEDELNQAREYMLAIANEGRANPQYRRQMGSKLALDLPTGLPPLALSDKYNNAAQEQADYCAEIKKSTHDNPKYASYGLRLNAFEIKVAAEAAGAGSLQNYPTNWMKSDTHYRPWWNLDKQISNFVGFGISKGDDGKWYSVAMLGKD